ncbi:MAG: T9SS type A sorting domain-containing protein [Saprospiraceae bacterium]|nr:T9SS type A sorting domain-containing protein [Saprospiraceae bacterium]
MLNVEINTDALKGLVNVTIFNIKGEQIKNQTMSVNGNAKINISDLQAGNYVLRVANDKNIVSKSIIVIK